MFNSYHWSRISPKLSSRTTILVQTKQKTFLNQSQWLLPLGLIFALFFFKGIIWLSSFSSFPSHNAIPSHLSSNFTQNVPALKHQSVHQEYHFPLVNNAIQHHFIYSSLPFNQLSSSNQLSNPYIATIIHIGTIAISEPIKNLSNSPMDLRILNINNSIYYSIN